MEAYLYILLCVLATAFVIMMMAMMAKAVYWAITSLSEDCSPSRFKGIRPSFFEDSHPSRSEGTPDWWKLDLPYDLFSPQSTAEMWKRIDEQKARLKDSHKLE